MDQQKPQIPSPPVNETRRRLTQGGLAAPIVLATLTSTNALATSTPYKCTISGKLSGNASAPGTKNCSSLGRSCDGWKQVSWTYYKKGECTKQLGQILHTDPNNKDRPYYMGACMKDVSYGGKRFKEFYSRKKDNNNVWRSVSPTTTGCVHMTLHEVLRLNDNSGAPNPAFGRETVAAFLNAVECAPNFPLKPEEVINMFNATCNGGHYQVKEGVYWGANEVCNYFSCLHPA